MEETNQVVKQDGGTKKQLPMKPILIGVAAVAILVIGYFGFSKIFKNNDEDVSYLEILDQDKLIPIEENDKYGYINTKGKVVIAPQYDKAGKFYDGYAVVTIKSNETNQEVAYIIDEKGNVKMQTTPQYYIANHLVQYIVEDKVWIIEEKLYNKDLKLISGEAMLVSYDEGVYTYYDASTNKYGIMNAKGKSIYEYQATGDETVSFDVSEVSAELEEQYCRVKISSNDKDYEKYGIINCSDGKVVVSIDSKYISVSDDNIFTLYAGDDSYSDEEKVMYIQGNKVLFQTAAKDGDVDLDYEDGGYLEIYDSSKSYSEGRYSYYIIATGTTTKDEPKNTNKITDFEEITGYSEFECPNGYGLMQDEQVVLSCEWEDMDFLSVNVYKYIKKNAKKEVLVLEKDDKTVLYDLKKKESLFSFNATSITDYSGSTFVKATDKENNEVVVYNLVTNKYLSFSKDLDITVYSNYITVEDDKTVKYYNTKLENIYTTSVK